MFHEKTRRQDRTRSGIFITNNLDRRLVGKLFAKHSSIDLGVTQSLVSKMYAEYKKFFMKHFIYSSTWALDPCVS